MGSVVTFNLTEIEINPSTPPPPRPRPRRRQAATVSNSQVALMNQLTRTRASHVVCFFLVQGTYVVSMEVRIEGPSARYFIHLPRFSFIIRLRWRMTSMRPEILHFRPSNTSFDEEDLAYLGGVAYTRPCSDWLVNASRSKVYVVGRDGLRLCDGLEEPPRDRCEETEGILV